jgi:AP-4 complex subunit beta-1
MNELSEYVTDVNADIAKKSIKCFGTIMIRLPSIAKTGIQQLRIFLSLQINYVTTQVIKILKDVLRKFPEFIDDVIEMIQKISLDQIEEIEGKIALVWILGQFGHKIEDAPYLLEKMVSDVKEINSPEFTGILLTSAFSLFFKRAPETKKLLSTVFKEVFNNSTDSTLKQKATFLYRLLKTDLKLAEEAANKSIEEFKEFFEDRNDEVRERLFWEFNSLSVVYNKPSERFLKETELKHTMAVEKKNFPDRKRSKRGTANTEHLLDEKPEETAQVAGNDSTIDKTQTSNTSTTVEDLLGFGPSTTS